MTETSCVISMTSHGDTTSGHVGGPVVCCEVKLVDIPEMNYTNADKPAPRGEVRPAALPHSLATPPLLNVMPLLCVMLLQSMAARPQAASANSNIRATFYKFHFRAPAEHCQRAGVLAGSPLFQAYYFFQCHGRTFS